MQVSGLNEVTAVATGGKDSLALLRGGKVMAWGSNLYGGLGDGKRGSEGEVVADVPTPVSGLSEVSAIAVGANHDLALLKNGTVMAWGGGPGDGELGDGTTTERDSPVKVTGLGEIVAIAAGYNFSLALKQQASWPGGGIVPVSSVMGRAPALAAAESPCSTTPVAVIGLSRGPIHLSRVRKRACRLDQRNRQGMGWQRPRCARDQQRTRGVHHASDGYLG